MQVIQIGDKFESKYDFRETCFGIVEVNNKFLLVNKKGQYSLVGGGIEKNESHEECLKREFLEEAGYNIIDTQELICIDCYWLAANKYPMESKANIYVVKIDLENKMLPLEDGHVTSFVNASEVMDLLPLPYHKEALKYYFEKISEESVYGNL